MYTIYDDDSDSFLKMGEPDPPVVSVATSLKNKKCRAFPAPFDVRLPVKNRQRHDEVTTVVQPDVYIVCNESKIDERGVCGAPDLVIEILSLTLPKKALLFLSSMKTGNIMDLYYSPVKTAWKACRTGFLLSNWPIFLPINCYDT